MLRSFALAALTLTLIAPPVLAADKPPISLAKTSKWEINYDDDACHLIGQFEGGGKIAIIALTQFDAGNSFELKIFGRMVTSDVLNLPIEISFGNQQKPFKRVGLSAKTTNNDQVPTVIIGDLRLDGWEQPAKQPDLALPPAITTAQEATITFVTFRPGRREVYRLETGQMDKPMAAMRECTEDLVRYWGFDPAVQSGLSKPPTPVSKPSLWLTTGDFPMDAAALGANGLVRFRLNVDETGKVTDCRVLFRTNPDVFADATCKLLVRRAKLSPARDAFGKPVKSYYLNSVRWLSSEW